MMMHVFMGHVVRTHHTSANHLLRGIIYGCDRCCGRSHIHAHCQWARKKNHAQQIKQGKTKIRAMAKIGYTRKPDRQNRVPLSTLVSGRHLIGQHQPRPDSASLHRLPDFNNTYPIMPGLFDQQPTCLMRHRVIAGRGTRRVIFAVNVVVRAAEL